MKLSGFRNYLSLIKFSHTIFALPYSFIGFALGVVSLRGNSTFNISFFLILFAKVLLCMVFARSAAMAFNRYIDRKYDALNPRTAKREIPSGVISPQNALFFTILSSLLFVITTWYINTLCFYLSFVALFVVLLYSYTKRFTSYCHLVLGLGLSLSPIGAYLAVTAHFDWLPVLFSFLVITWVSGFDIIYALQDEDFDRNLKLNSIPVKFGLKNALYFSSFLHVLSGVFVLVAGFQGHFSWIYWVGAASYIGLLTYQHLIVKPTDISKVNIAFANVNGIASVLFSAFTLVSLFY